MCVSFAGEVDLKVGLKVSEFISKYKPYVVDCTVRGEVNEDFGDEEAFS